MCKALILAVLLTVLAVARPQDFPAQSKAGYEEAKFEQAEWLRRVTEFEDAWARWVPVAQENLDAQIVDRKRQLREVELFEKVRKAADRMMSSPYAPRQNKGKK